MQNPLHLLPTQTRKLRWPADTSRGKNQMDIDLIRQASLSRYKAHHEPKTGL